MTILVTGGAGYIGSVVVERLIERGDEVIVIDNLSTGHKDAVEPGAVLIEGDFGDRTLLAATFAKYRFDAVVHLAASTLVGESMERPLDYFQNNVANSLALLQTMLAHNVKKIIFASTSSVYSTNNSMPLSEASLVEPDSVYGYTKLVVEQMFERAHEAHGLNYTIFRFFNAAGATEKHGEDREHESHLIPVVLRVASGERKELQIFGNDYPTPDGTGVRDYIYVGDLARGIIDALAIKKSFTCNLGTGHGASVLEIVAAVQNATGRIIPTIIGPRRAGDPAMQAASFEQAKKEFGWEPQLSDLNTIIKTSADWRKKFPHGYAQ